MRTLFVCLLLCVPQGRDVFANYTGTILQVTINNLRTYIPKKSFSS
jgi:hypothetical protein